jgi:fumarylacetoacetate (FAA) hydrolase
MLGGMRLGTLRDGSRDGALIVVDPSGTRYLRAASVVPTLQAALDTWEASEPGLRALAETITRDAGSGEPLDVNALEAPLPRAYEWIDGSAYLSHVRLVRQARGADMPADFLETPLVYQGGSGVLLAPTAPLIAGDPAWGLDFEAEVAVVLGDVPLGSSREHALAHVRLLMLANDATYRGLVAAELARGFGFFQSKPATAFSPFAVTPDELGAAYRDGRVHLRLRTTLNGTLVGDVSAGPEMHFAFPDLIQHVARTRALVAGTILGSGTVSNAAPERGVSCLVERRARETIELGAAQTGYLSSGDRVRIEMLDESGRSVFGAIDQVVR